VCAGPASQAPEAPLPWPANAACKPTSTSPSAFSKLSNLSEDDIKHKPLSPLRVSQCAAQIVATVSPSRSGKRLPVMLRLAQEERKTKLVRVREKGGGLSDEMLYVGSSLTSEGSVSLDSRSGGVHMTLGSAATEGSPPWVDKEGWGEELRDARAENAALKQEVYGLLGAHVRAEQASKSYVRSVALLAKTLVQVEHVARRQKEDDLTRDTARLGRIVVSRGADGRTVEEWQEGYEWVCILRVMPLLLLLSLVRSCNLSCIFYEKSPISYKTSHIFYQKSPLFYQKSPIAAPATVLLELPHTRPWCWCVASTAAPAAAVASVATAMSLLWVLYHFTGK